jgi:ABC-type transport system involved in cytochrome c biogenesis permease component
MLENPKVNIKIKLSALWTSVLFCYVYGDYFELYVPEKVDGLLTGVNMLDSPTKLLIASLVLAIPAVMIALSILLTPRINRFLNVFFGILFTLMMLLIGINSLTPWYSFYAFLAFLESFITISIVWFAWKWPKKITDLN